MSKIKNSILAIDIGTSSIKCCVIDLNGLELYSSSTQYSLINPKPGIFELDSEELWNSVAKTIKDVLTKAESSSYTTNYNTNYTNNFIINSSGNTDNANNRGNADNNTETVEKEKIQIIAVGICAMMIMPVFLDKNNKVIRPIIHWFDERLQQQYFKLKANGIDKIISKFSGSALTGESTVNAINLIKTQEPDNYKKINKFFMIKDFIRYKLTNQISTDYGDASGTQLLNSKEWDWANDLIKELGFKKEMFVDILKPSDIGGYVSREASKLTGIPFGVPVCVGSGDGITTIFGLGTYQNGQTGIIIGSAGILATSSLIFPEDNFCRTYIFCHPFGDRWYSFMATASSGATLKWYLDYIIKDKKISFEDLDKEAEQVNPGSDGVVFLPYIMGSRNPYSNPKACGVFLGLRYKHDRKYLTRAVLEGISFEILDLLMVQEEILKSKGLKIKEVKLAGGIINSNFWCQLLTDILQKDLIITKNKELGTLGSAIFAAVAAGAYSNLESAIENMVKQEKIIKHSLELKNIYKKKFEIFKETYNHLSLKFDLYSESLNNYTNN